jgi:uncharacterized membrane protein
MGHHSQRLSYPCLIAYFSLTATLTITTPVMARKVKIVRTADWVRFAWVVDSEVD